MRRTLTQFLGDMLTHIPLDSADLAIQNVQMDSRCVQPGDVYVAITCDASFDHIQTALAAGAVAVVLERSLWQREDHRLSILLNAIPYGLVDNARESLSILAERSYPNQPSHLYAVTGTNGKSSVTTFLRQLLELLGQKVASYGTVGLEMDVPLKNEITLPKLTTLDALSLHRLLNVLAEEGVDHFAFEASSHGLDQCRLHKARVSVAGFTNFTQDHLDYHTSMETYFEAKARLFTQILQEGGTAVLNGKSSHSQSLRLMIQEKPLHIATYGTIDAGKEGGFDIEARNIQINHGHIVFDLYEKNEYVRKCQLNMVGGFQVENTLCALGMVQAGLNQGREIPLTLRDILGDDQERDLLSELISARGRMELAGQVRGSDGTESMIYVDYAHTPDALSRALQALRKHLEGTSGRLHVVFGCGGNRDALKRSQMGQIAQELADEVIVTDDNPRDEDPAFIRAQILAACPKARDVPDRLEAIRLAIDSLKSGDILLISGKGHETGQLIRGNTLPFDDVTIVAELTG